VGSRCRDDNGDITDFERSKSMIKKDLCLWMGPGEVPRDAAHLPFGHWAVGLVFQPVDLAAFVLVAHDAHEKGEPAVSVAPYGGQQRTGIERAVRKEGHRSMIRPRRESNDDDAPPPRAGRLHA
jgi:hypothetical protein